MLCLACLSHFINFWDVFVHVNETKPTFFFLAGAIKEYIYIDIDFSLRSGTADERWMNLYIWREKENTQEQGWHMQKEKHTDTRSFIHACVCIYICVCAGVDSLCTHSLKSSSELTPGEFKKVDCK